MVSAIITTKNRVELLKRAVLSVLNQTYKNIELIIIDDNSEDETEEYCKELLKDKINIKYLKIPEIESTGANHARNVGIELSQGDYVAFLDDDDEWKETKIEEIINQFKKDLSLGLVFSSVEKKTTFDESKIELKTIVKLEKYKSKNMKHNIIWSNFIGGTSNPVIKKEVLLNVKGFDELLMDRQDYELWIRILQKYKAFYIDKPLTIYNFEINTRKQITSKVTPFVESSEYIYKKHENLFNTLTKNEKKQREYSDYWLICERTLYTKDKKEYKKYLKKRIKLNHKLTDYILLFFTIFNSKRNIKLKLIFDILQTKTL